MSMLHCVSLQWPGSHSGSYRERLSQAHYTGRWSRCQHRAACEMTTEARSGPVEGGGGPDMIVMLMCQYHQIYVSYTKAQFSQPSLQKGEFAGNPRINENILGMALDKIDMTSRLFATKLVYSRSQLNYFGWFRLHFSLSLHSRGRWFLFHG